MRKILFSITIFFVANISLAQEVLTLNDALKIALSNSFSIQLAKNDAEITKINNSTGAAGMLPQITGVLNQDNQSQNTRQKFITGAENNRDGAKTTLLNGGVELGWTIFNGFKMFATRNKLKELQDIGELKMKFQIEQTFARITKSYADAVGAKQQLKSNEELVKISEERLRLAMEKNKAGRAAKTEVLRAQVDLNTDKSLLMRQENTLQNAKMNLNILLGRNAETSFDVQDSLPVSSDYQLEQLLGKTNDNTTLQIAKKNQYTGMLALREARADRFPVIQLKTGYNFSNQQSQAGLVSSSVNNGYHFGAGLNINLFNGFDVNRKIQVAKLSYNSIDLQYKDSLLRVQAAIRQAYQNYVLSKKLLDFEKENVTIAVENFEISAEQYKVGVITSLEYREAQQNLLNARLRFTQAMLEAKMNESEIQRLSGELVKE